MNALYRIACALLIMYGHCALAMNALLNKQRLISAKSIESAQVVQTAQAAFAWYQNAYNNPTKPNTQLKETYEGFRNALLENIMQNLPKISPELANLQVRNTLAAPLAALYEKEVNATLCKDIDAANAVKKITAALADIKKHVITATRQPYALEVQQYALGLQAALNKRVQEFKVFPSIKEEWQDTYKLILSLA